MDGWMYYALAGLPLVNGLVTSVALETALLARGSNGLPLRDAFETAVGMSFISMLMMEVGAHTTPPHHPCGFSILARCNTDDTLVFSLRFTLERHVWQDFVSSFVSSLAHISHDCIS